MRLYWQRQMQHLTIGAVGLNFPQPMSLSLSHHLEFPCGALGGGFVTPFFIKFKLVQLLESSSEQVYPTQCVTYESFQW